MMERARLASRTQIYLQMIVILEGMIAVLLAVRLILMEWAK
jgi:hypothetical protein